MLGFGKQTSGIASSPKVVTLKNNGTTTYTIGTVAFVGANSSDFTKTTTCGTTVAAGATCTYSIVFTPTASEIVDDQMTITASNGSVLGVQLQGTGNIPIFLTPRKMTFPNTLLGTTSAANDGYIYERKRSEHHIHQDRSGRSESERFQHSANQHMPDAGECHSGARARVVESQVTFHPTVNPAINETVTQVYYGNFTLVKQGLLINGVGTAVKVSPTSITFPSTKVGSTTTSVVTFQNAGSTTMQISSANFVNGTANVFSIQSNTCNFVSGSGGSVPANSSCTFTLAFTPTTTGTQTATFQIGDGDITGPQKVSLSGTGTN